MSKPIYNNSDALQKLLNGAVIVLPSDTVYGLAAVATNRDAVKRLYRLKEREHKPGTVVAANVEQLVELGISRVDLKSAAEFWPGPVSVIVPAGPELKYLHQGLDSLAVRIPADEEFRELIGRTGPLLTSSANLPGLAVANTTSEAMKYFGDQVDMYVDGGDLGRRQPSAVIKITSGQVEVLRGNQAVLARVLNLT